MVNMTEDEYGFPETFECMHRPKNETSTAVTLEFFYDLAFVKPSNNDNNSTSESLATLDLSRAFVEGSLVQQLAAYYGFWDGLACQGPLPNRVWFIKLSSLEKDVPNPNLSSCYSLEPKDTEECVSFMGTMTGEIVGWHDTLDTVSLMAQQFNSNAVTATTDSIRVLFLGLDLDYGTDSGRDALPPAKNNVAANSQTANADNHSVTKIGIAMVAGLTFAVMGLVFAIVRKRRASSLNNKSFQEFEDESKSHPKLDEESTKSHCSRDVDGDILNDDDNLPDSPDEFSREYNFDLGGWMKSELLGIHGESTITAHPSRGAPEEVESDDNDSWAQTEGTIGSLELRLEPIEAEV
jgi:hypothetical protein